MSKDERPADEPTKSKSRKKSKGQQQQQLRLLTSRSMKTFDAMLDSASKSANLAASVKPKSARRSNAEAASGWSNEMEGGDDNEEYQQPPPVIRRTNRRAAEEIVATDIPTIQMDDADGDDSVTMAPEVAVAPEFSIHQIASFKDMESEFSRERASQYIDPKIDIGILYQNLHLQEEFDLEDQKPWDWDKLFVEVRNTFTNPIVE